MLFYCGTISFCLISSLLPALPADASNRIRAAVGQALALFVHEANVIFSKTTFLPGSQAAEGVLTAIQTVRVYVNVEEMRTFRPGTALTDSLLSAEAVLTDWSTVSATAWQLPQLNLNYL